MVNRLGILSVFLSILIVSACSSASNVGESDVGNAKSAEMKTKVVFWDLFSGGDGAVMTEIVKEFNETHPNIEVEKITQEWGEYYTKLTTSVLGNKAPDLGVSHATRVLQLSTEGVIQPLDEEAARNGIDFSDFAGTSIEVTTFDGKHYAVPIDYHALLLFWNKPLAEKYGVLDENGKPIFKNYDEFVSMLLKIKETGGDIMPLAINGNGTHPFRFWYSVYKQMGGGDIYNSNQNKATIDPEIGLKSLKAVYDLFHTHKVISPGIKKVDEVFQSEKAVFMINGTWAVNNTLNGLKDKLDVMEFPNLFGTPAVYADSHTFILPKNPRRDQKTADAAMTFVKWVTDNGWKWSKAGHLPTTNKVLESEELKKQPLRDKYKEEVKQMVFLPPNPKVWFASYSQLSDVFDALWINQTTPEEALKNIEQVINEALK